MNIKTSGVHTAVAVAGVACSALIAWPHSALGAAASLSPSLAWVARASNIGPDRSGMQRPHRAAGALMLRLAGPAPIQTGGYDTRTPAARKPAPAKTRRALNLALPDARTAQADDDSASDPGNPKKPERQYAEPNLLVWNLVGAAASTPQVKPDNLFKAEYGLRGFMAQSWLTQRIGIQGGLGLNDEHLLTPDDDWRNDIAVGMGVVLAF